MEIEWNNTDLLCLCGCLEKVLLLPDLVSLCYDGNRTKLLERARDKLDLLVAVDQDAVGPNAIVGHWRLLDWLYASGLTNLPVTASHMAIQKMDDTFRYTGFLSMQYGDFRPKASSSKDIAADPIEPLVLRDHIPYTQFFSVDFDFDPIRGVYNGKAIERSTVVNPIPELWQSHLQCIEESLDGFGTVISTRALIES